VISADRFKSKTKAMTFLVKPEMWKELEKEMTIVMPSDQATITYGNIDFTNVGQIKVSVAVAPTYFSGGKLDVLIDNENGQKAGTGELEVGLTDLGMKEIIINITPVDGVHDLVLKSSSKDPSKIFAGIISLEFIRRK